MTATQPHMEMHPSFLVCYASTGRDATESSLETKKGLQVLLRRSRAKPLLCFAVWLVFLFSFAPDGMAQYRFDTWTTENGLPQNTVADILQTRDGYLWLATYGGLVRFDGARFVVFDRNIEGIKSQRINALFEDSKGTLWAGSEDGMLIRYRDGKFATYTVEDGLPHAIAVRIEEDDEGNLWINWLGEIIAVTKFDGERFVNYKPGDFAHGVSGDIGRKRYPWWSQDSEGLHCLVKGRVRTYSFQSDLPEAHVFEVKRDQYGNLWIQTTGAGVVKATDGQLKLYTMQEGLPNNNPDGLFLEDRKGNLWFANPWEHLLYRIRDGKHELMPLLSPAALYEDREGSIWIATLEGLRRVRESTITLITEREGLSSNSVYSIFQDRAGAIWIGTWAGGGGVNRYENGRFTHYRFLDGLPSNYITCIYEDDSGRLWVGTSGGLTYFENGRFTSYDDEYGFLKHHVWAIHEDRTGNLWFASDRGLVKLRDGQFTRYTSKDGLSYDWATTLLEDRTGALWIGTYHGLTRLKDGVFTAYTSAQGFIGNQVRAIYEDGDGILWIGTYDGGLYRLKDERLTRYTTKEGLHDNGVFQILEDDAGNLWMGCNRGIYRVSRRELNDFAEGRARSITSVVFGTKDGLSSLECNGGRQPSGLKTEDGRLWFPTMGGVAIVDPKAVQVNNVPPPVIIEEFRLGNETIDFTNGIEIPPDKNNFEIRYSAPSFIKPDQIRFRYMIEGLDEDWIEAGDRRTASYYRIPAGRYRFRVIAANNDGVWNETGAAVEFYLRPYFYETWWFYPLCLVLGVVTVIVVVIGMQRRHVKQLKEKAEAERIAAYSIIAAGVVHDVKNPLGTLLFRIHNIREGINRPKEVKSQLDAIEKTTDRLKHLTNALRDFAEPQPLQFALTDVGKLLKDVVTIYRREHDANFPQIEVRPAGQSKDGVQSILPRIAMDKHQMERVLLNLIGNAVKHAKGLSTVRLSAEVKQERLSIQVANDGTGIEAEHLPRIFAPFFTTNKKMGSGLGLAIVQQIVKGHGGTITVKSQPENGTVFTIYLPVENLNDLPR